MASFIVMEPPAGDAAERAEKAVFIRDRFSFLAFVAPVVWLLWHRLWIETGLTLVATLALAWLGSIAGFGGAAPLLSLLVALYLGLEGNGLRIATLRRRGWREWGAVDARDRGDAELRYAHAIETDGPMPQAPARDEPVEPRRQAGVARPALGLLDYPGAR